MTGQHIRKLQSYFHQIARSTGLRFYDPADELDFKKRYVESTVRITQLFLAVGGLSFLSYYEQDILIDPNNHYTANLIRFFYATPLILMCSIVLFFSKFKPYVELIVVINGFVINSAQVWIFSNLSHGYNYSVVGFAVIFLALSITFIIRIGYLVIIALFALIGVLGGHVLANNSDPGWIVVNAIGIITAIIMGMVSATIRERTARSQFMANRALDASQARAQALLCSMLPEKIVGRIQAGETDIADALDEVCVVFADIAGFTSLSRRLSPTDLIRLLDSMFSRFDGAVERCSMEKITTIGDAYLAVGGMSGATSRKELAMNAAKLALAIREEVDAMIVETDYPINVRIGIHIGPIVAGVVGERRPTFDCWGDTVRIATTLEAHAPVGSILMSAIACDALCGVAEVGAVQAIKIKDISEEVSAHELIALHG